MANIKKEELIITPYLSLSKPDSNVVSWASIFSLPKEKIRLTTLRRHRQKTQTEDTNTIKI
jgi:hypothetical protein